MKSVLWGKRSMRGLLDSIGQHWFTGVTNSGNESSMSQMNATHFIFRGDWVWISSLEMSESGIKGLISIWSTSTIKEQLVEISICTLIVSNICTSIQATNTLGVAQPAESHTVTLLLSKNCSISNLKLEMTTASPFTSFKCANLRVKPRHLGHGSSWWRHSGRALRPWKIIFAFIPPTDYCGGQGCEFFLAFDVLIWVEIGNPSIFFPSIWCFRYNCHSSDLFMTGWVCFCFSLIFIGWALRSLKGLRKSWSSWGKSDEQLLKSCIYGRYIIILWYIHGEREYFPCLV